MTTTTFGHRAAGGAAQHMWMWTVALGTATVILGLVLITNPFSSARTLAVLVAIGVIAHGLLEGLRARRSPRPTAALGAGALLVLGGLVALIWPGITLWVLAVLVGMSIVLAGAVKVTAALADRKGFPGWPWLLAGGALSVVVGIVAVAWPEATIVVLAVIFGLHITVLGILEIAAGLQLHRQASTPG
jgi:uncharacterized membrane protein HdeD (DUF308 family)